MYKLHLKRVLDLLTSIIALIILTPIFILLYFILFLITQDNPLFFQSRPGKNEKTFHIIKFKTMTNRHDSEGNLLPDEERLTSFGNFLRRTSLDEIPQLINVLRGDMSLVGPRPLRVHYLPYYSKRESLRHTVRPGVTGLAQVTGRNAISWDDKLEKDVEYVESLSFSLDIVILLKTIKKVVFGSDVIMDDTMQTFDEYRTKKIQ